MRTIFLLITILSVVTIGVLGGTAKAGPPDSNAGILDGKVFIGHVGPKGREADGEDMIVFQDGQLLSTSCSKYGFGSAAYTAFRDGSNFVFQAVTHSPKHGQIEWHGKIVGDQIEATYLWTKDRWYWFDAREEHWLKAHLKKD